MFLPAILLLLPACSGDDDPAGPTDTTAPATITDLYVATQTDTTMTVTWTVQGDDGTTGTATAYDVRHHSVAITQDNWNETTAVTGPEPLPAGSEQVLVIRDPNLAKADLHVAVKAVDEAGNWSGLSNVVSGSFPDPPFLIRRLATDGDDRYPCLNDDAVCWVSRSGAGAEICVAGLNVAYPAVTVLTDNGGQKEHPSSHGSTKIVWQGRANDSEDWEIWTYSPLAYPRFQAHTDNDLPDRRPVLAGGGDFAWVCGHTMYEEIRYWNEAGHRESVISDVCCPTDEYYSNDPVAHDGLVLRWSYPRVSGGSSSAWLWDRVARDITDDLGGSFTGEFSLYVGMIAFGSGLSPAEISYYDGSTVEIIGQGWDPSLHDGRIAFAIYDGHDYEIAYGNGIEVRQVTDNDINDDSPTLWGDYLAWMGRPAGGSGQIYYTSVE